MGHHPSQHLGHSHHPKGHPLSSPPPPPWQPWASQVWTPCVCGLVWPLSLSVMVSRFVCVSLISVAEWTPLCAHTTSSSPTCLPTLGGLTVWLQRIQLL